jgi:hypothetical protein
MITSLNSMQRGGKDGGGISRAKADYSGGSGPFNARYFTDASLPQHTIYAPKTVIKGKKLPLIVWGNGACGANGAGFANFLTEIASYGFLIVANGNPKAEWGKGGAASLASANGEEKTRAIQLLQSIDWAAAGAAGGKFGEVDMSKLAAAGQSCGGVQAYSAAYSDPRIKVLAIFNTGVIDPGRRWMLKELKQDVALFHGGKGDFAYEKMEGDFKRLPGTINSLKASLEVGHMGTYFEEKGGKVGKGAAAFFKWQLQGDAAAKSLFFNSSSALYKDGWKIDMSQWRDR